MANQITSVADEILRDLENSADTSVPVIDFWLRSNLGQLNNRLDICVVIENNDFSPQLTDQEKEIFKAIYKIDWYARQIRNFTGAGGYSIQDQVTQLKENGRTTTIAPRNNTAKVLTEFRKELVSELSQLIISYKFNKSDPRESRVTNDCDFHDGFSAHYYRSPEY